MVVERFVDIAHRIVWCSVATVDRAGRPRTRILHPIWEPDGEGGLRGWIATRPTPLKVSHLARSPFLSCSYWDATHDVAIAECRAEWVGDDEQPVKDRVWRLFADAPPPLGWDPHTAWPGGPVDMTLLRLTPWRLHVADLETLKKRTPPLTWRADPVTLPSS
jgi:hypothetical protein